MVRENKAIIERTRRLGAGWQRLALAVEDPALEHIQPGQTLLADTGDYLRENWIPVGFDSDEGVLLIEHPLARTYTPGDVINLLGPVGTPFQLRYGVRHLLLVALDYVPTRLLFLLNQAIKKEMAITLVLTGEATQYPITTLPPVVEVITGDEVETWPSQEETLTWADQVFLLTSPLFWEDRYLPLLYTLSKLRPALPEGFLQGILDMPMPCGTGACAACMVRTSNGTLPACVDGPAFDVTGLKFL